MPLWVSSKPGLAAEKLKNLPIEKVKDIAARSFVKNQYFVSGRLPKEVYADDAYFKDPTQTTQGADKWSRLVPLLFDAPKSKVQLISTNVKDSHHFEFRCAKSDRSRSRNAQPSWHLTLEDSLSYGPCQTFSKFQHECYTLTHALQRRSTDAFTPTVHISGFAWMGDLHLCYWG